MSRVPIFQPYNSKNSDSIQHIISYSRKFYAVMATPPAPCYYPLWKYMLKIGPLHHPPKTAGAGEVFSLVLHTARQRSFPHFLQGSHKTSSSTSLLNQSLLLQKRKPLNMSLQREPPALNLAANIQILHSCLKSIGKSSRCRETIIHRNICI